MDRILRVGRHLKRSDCLPYWLDFHPKDVEKHLQMMRNRGLRLFATHNPYIVDLFDASEVRCEVRPEDSGVIRHAQLSEHPAWPRSKDTLSTGEFWASVGEEWILGK